MFNEPDPDISAMAEKVYGLTVGLNPGETLPNERVIHATGLTPHRGRWGVVVAKVRRRLLADRGIACWPNHGGGLLLCTPEQQLMLPAERFKRGARQVRRGRVAVEALPVEALTDNQSRLRALLSEKSRAAERSARAEAAAIRSILKGRTPA